MPPIASLISLLLTLLAFALASPPNFRTTPGSSCASLCNAATTRVGLSCDDGAPERGNRFPLRLCLTCLCGSGYMTGEESNRKWMLCYSRFILIQCVFESPGDGAEARPESCSPEVFANLDDVLRGDVEPPDRVEHERCRGEGLGSSEPFFRYLSRAQADGKHGYITKILTRRNTGTGTALPRAAIAGIAAGSALGLFLAIALLLRRRHARRNKTPGKEGGSPPRWGGPRKTASSLDFRCRTRVTPLASRADLRRVHDGGGGGEDGTPAKDAGRADGALAWGVGPGDALGSNLVLEGTLAGYTPTAVHSPRFPPGGGGDGGDPAGSQTVHTRPVHHPASSAPSASSAGTHRSATLTAVPTPAHSPPSRDFSPHTPLSSATPSSTRSTAPLLPRRPALLPARNGSASPYGAGSPPRRDDRLAGYSPVGPLAWGTTPAVPARALRTQKGRWDLYNRSRREGAGEGGPWVEVERE